MKRSVGIDFGTSTTLISVRDVGNPARVLVLGELDPWIPSVFGIDKSGNILIGEDALNKLTPERILFSTKSLIGRRQKEVELCGTTLKTSLVAQEIISKAMQSAKELEGSGIFKDSDVYVSCPAGWTYEARRELANIYVAVGLDIDVGDFIDEPVAASLHWKNEHWQNAKGEIQGKTVVYDAGGGTLDIALVEIGVDNEFTVLSTEGLPISGDHLDNGIIQELQNQIQSSDLEKIYLPNLGLRAREIKENLSTQMRREIPLGRGFDSVVSMDRSTLEDVFSSQLEKSLNRAKATVRAAQTRTRRNISPTEIRSAEWSEFSDEIRYVALVGGMSQIPVVTARAKIVFPKATVEVLPNPQSSVVLGLTYGREVEQLNLPRPPVRFIADCSDGFKSWSEVVYEAFTPLYDSAEVSRGSSHLGLTWEMVNKGSSTLHVEIRAEAPNRSKSTMTFKEIGEAASRTSFGFDADHGEVIRFKMYANGDLELVGGQSQRQQLELRLEKWPKAKGSMIIEVSQSSPLTSNYRFDEGWRNR